MNIDVSAINLTQFNGEGGGSSGNEEAWLGGNRMAFFIGGRGKGSKIIHYRKETIQAAVKIPCQYQVWPEDLSFQKSISRGRIMLWETVILFLHKL